MELVALAALATSALQILQPYLKKAGEKVAEVAGERVFNAIFSRTAPGDATRSALERLKADPSDSSAQAGIEDRLMSLLRQDQALQAELKQIISSSKGGDVNISGGDGSVNAYQIDGAVRIVNRKS